MINIIAAVGKNNELGYENKLLWSLPGDMKYFRETTTGNTVVMGRKTYESIGKPLPNRRNIVITSQNLDIPGVEIISDPLDVLNIEGNVFVMGGASIYKTFIDKADKLYLTEVEAEATADAFFPEFDKNQFEREIIGQNSDNDIQYSFVLYKRK